MPSLEVHLAPDLGLRPDVLRLPITELGCSGGAAAIAFAHRHLTAFPDHKVLVLAVELPSLNFQPGDTSPWVDYLKSRGARVAIVPDTGHFTQLEAPDTVNRLIAEFCRSTGAPSASRGR